MHITRRLLLRVLFGAAAAPQVLKALPAQSLVDPHSPTGPVSWWSALRSLGVRLVDVEYQERNDCYLMRIEPLEQNAGQILATQWRHVVDIEIPLEKFGIANEDFLESYLLPAVDLLRYLQRVHGGSLA